MDNLIIAEIEGALYGIRESEAIRTEHVSKFHMFPMAPAHFCGMAEMEGSMASLYDLGACLGHAGMDISRGGHAIIISMEGRPRGFGLSGLLGVFDLDMDDVIALPSVASSRAFEGCVIHEGRPVVIVDIKMLHDEASGDNWTLPIVQLKDKSIEARQPSSVRLFGIDGDVFAADDALVGQAEEIGAAPMRLPLAPSFVEGLVLMSDGTLRAAINLPSALGEPAEMKGSLYLPSADGELMLHIDSDLGARDSFRIAELPPLATCSAFAGAALIDGAAHALVNPAALSSMITRPQIAGLYAEPSGIIEEFGNRNIRAREFELIGDLFSVPAAQVKDVLDILPYTAIPGSRSIMVGVARHDEDVLPVLDPALCFGLESEPDISWKMILIENGRFSALLLAPAVHDEIDVDKQRQFLLPIHQSYRYVYGCYTSAEKVRLLLNIKSLAVHFDRAHVSHVFDSMHKRPKPAISASEMPKAAAVVAATAIVSEAEQAASAPATEKPLHEALAESAAEAQAAYIAGAQPEAETATAEPEDQDASSSNEALSNYLAEAPDMYATVQDAGGSMSAAVPFAGPAPDMQESYETSSTDAALDDYLGQEPDISATPAAGNEAIEEPLEEAAAFEIKIALEQEAALKEAAALEEKIAREQEAALKEAAALEEKIALEQEAALKEAAALEEKIAREQEAALEEAAFEEAFTHEQDAALDEEFERSTEDEALITEEAATELDTPPVMEAQAGIAKKIGTASETPSSEPDNLSIKPEGEESIALMEPSPAADNLGAAPARPKDKPRTRMAGSRAFLLAALALLLSLVPFLYYTYMDNAPRKPQVADKAIAPEPAAEVARPASPGPPEATPPEAMPPMPEPPEAEPAKPEPMPEPVKEIQEQLKPEEVRITQKDDGSLLIEVQREFEPYSYKVRSGDTLWHISGKYTGNPFNYPVIANENKIKNPDLIFPGQKVEIRPMEKLPEKKP